MKLKKIITRKAFPSPSLKRIEDDTILLSQPPNQCITENATPSSDDITTATTFNPNPSPPTPTPSPSPKTKVYKSNVITIGYKFHKFSP